MVIADGRDDLGRGDATVLIEPEHAVGAIVGKVETGIGVGHRQLVITNAGGSA